MSYSSTPTDTLIFENLDPRVTKQQIEEICMQVIERWPAPLPFDFQGCNLPPRLLLLLLSGISSNRYQHAIRLHWTIQPRLRNHQVPRCRSSYICMATVFRYRVSTWQPSQNKILLLASSSSSPFSVKQMNTVLLLHV